MDSEFSESPALIQSPIDLKAEAVDYVTGLENSYEPPAPVVALLIDASAEGQELEALKAAALQARLTHPKD